MRTLNFLKTLFCAALLTTAFTACSDDDAEEGGYSGIPEITVNGVDKAVVAAELAGGTTEAVEVVTKGNWVLTFNTPADAGWCTPSKMSGKTGTTPLTFKLGETNASRETVVTLTVTGLIVGQPITKVATITIKQNEAGSTDAETNVAEIRSLLKAMNPTGTKVPVTTEIAAKTITGVVVSNAATDNMGNKYLIALSDADGQPNSGLTINATKFKDMALAAGAVVTASLTDAQVSTYNGLLQLSLNDQAAITSSPGTVLTPITVTVDKVLDYESQYVKVETCQAADGAHGVAWYVAGSGNNKGNVNFASKSGLAFVVRTSQYASYKADIVPDKSGYIQGIAGRFNDDIQIMPQSAADIAGLTEARFEPDYTKATINQIAAEGNYEIDATIVGVHSKGVMFADNAGGKNNFILAFDNSWTTQTSNLYKDKVNFKSVAKGPVKDQHGLWQFVAPEITTSTQNVFALGTPATFDAAGIAAYVNAIKADEKASEYKYVKLSGALTIKDEGSYNSYTLAVEGLSTDLVKTVTMAYGFDSYYTGIVDGDVVDVEGFALGFDTTQDKLNIMVTKVTKNTTKPAISITSTPTAFAAAGGTQDVTFNPANIPSGSSVFAKIEGADAAQFSVGAVANDKVTVTALENATEVAKNAKLVVYIAPSAGAAAVASDEVELTQVAKLPDGAKTATFDFSTITTTGTISGPMTVDGVTLTPAKADGQTAPGFNKAGEWRLYKQNTLTISGGTISRVEIATNGTMGSTVLVNTGTLTKVDKVWEWTGSAASVTITNGTSSDATTQLQMKDIVVTYQ